MDGKPIEAAKQRKVVITFFIKYMVNCRRYESICYCAAWLNKIAEKN